MLGIKQDSCALFSTSAETFQIDHRRGGWYLEHVNESTMKQYLVDQQFFRLS